MFDSFYTPTALAEKLTNYVSKKNVSLIADFSVGDGELLRAAEKKWPHASMIASDVHDEVLRMTKRQHSSWLVGRCDFLNPRSRNLCKPLRHHIGLVDLVLLNPPFSCGRKTIRVMLDGREFRSGAAIAFVALSLEYLQSGGELFAIMPQSCSHSLRDRELWEYLQRKHGLKELANVSRNRFEGCDPKVIFISLIKGKISVVRNTKVGSGANMRLSSATPMRGKTSMVRAMKKGKYPLYHTTHLQDHTLQATGQRQL